MHSTLNIYGLAMSEVDFLLYPFRDKKLLKQGVHSLTKFDSLSKRQVLTEVYCAVEKKKKKRSKSNHYILFLAVKKW